MSKFSMESTLKDVLNDDDGRRILVKNLGNLVENPIIDFVKGKNLNEVVQLAGGMITTDQVEAIKSELLVLND